jgi:putative ABC transport system substrate-binding protein
MNQRRLLLLALGAGFASHTAPLRAQNTVVGLRRVGVLAPSTRAKEDVILAPFFEQMRRLGWVEGQNIQYDRVYAGDEQQMLGRLAVELVARRPEVIYATITPAPIAASRATQTIPIVFAFVADPVSDGLVQSLAHPGGNVTGMSSAASLETGPKRVALLREILPGIKRIGLLGDATDPSTKLQREVFERSAASRGLTFVFAEAANPVEFDAALTGVIAQQVDAISTVGTAALVGNLRARLIELADQRRIPVIAASALYADSGALFSYGVNLADFLRRSALLVDKVLKGAKPADLPVEQPAVFEFVVNLKAAKTLGITIPQAILLRADRVIE